MKPKPKILYIEDEIKFEQEFPKTLQSEGYEVDQAEDGDEALQKLRAGGEQYALIILDIMMPTGVEIAGDKNAKGGYETGKVILRILRHELELETPVIVLTAYGNSQSESELREYGISEFVGKPTSPKDLLRHVTNQIGGEGQP